jgi:SAM-dependent methyltransferase
MSDPYSQDINASLLSSVPATAKRILHVGCGDGQLGAALKRLDPERVVYGIDSVPGAAEASGQHLDQVFNIDVAQKMPDIPDASLDCILYDQALAQLVDPLATLRRHRQLLKPGGEIICCVPNIQHLSILRNLLAGNFQYEAGGLMNNAHLRFFTYSTFIKLLLDAGFVPELISAINIPDRADLLEAAAPLIQALGLDPSRTNAYLTAYQYIFRGVPLDWEKGESEVPLSFVVCVNNEEQLNANLLRSPCFKAPTPHQLILVRNAASAGEGLNLGIEQAVNEIVVLLHQDVYLPPGWTRRFISQYRLAEKSFGPIGLAGFFGVLNNHGQKREFGHLIDRHTHLSRQPLPALVETVDEFAMAVPRATPLRFDPSLGWHLYGADFALQTMQHGHLVCVLDALCFHHSNTGYTLPDHYFASAQVFRKKWQKALPIFTPCANFE